MIQLSLSTKQDKKQLKIRFTANQWKELIERLKDSINQDFPDGFIGFSSDDDSFYYSFEEETFTIEVTSKFHAVLSLEFILTENQLQLVEEGFEPATENELQDEENIQGLIAIGAAVVDETGKVWIHKG